MSAYSQHRTWRPGWAAGAPTTGRPRRSAGSRSSSSPSRSAGWRARRRSTRTRPGRASPGRMDRILDAGFKQPAGESVLIQSTLAPTSRSGVHGRDRGRRRRRSRDARRRPERALAPRPEQRGQISATARMRRSSSSRSAETPTTQWTRSTPFSTGSTRRRQAHPQFFIGEFGDASAVERCRDRVRGRPREGRACSRFPVTLLDPRDRVRGARGRGHSAAARADRRLRHLRSRRAARATCCPWRTRPPAIVLLIGLAVGVDYSLFYLRREREERAAGRSERAAVEAAAATSGRSVLISGLTVMIAMAGMFLTGDQIFASLGVATIIVVAVAVLGSLTVLPALLSRLGDKVDRRPRSARRPPAARRRRRPDLGRDRRPRPASAGTVGRPRRRAAGRARDSRDPAPHGRSRARTRSRSPCPRSRPTTACRRRSPARRFRRTSSSKAPDVNAPTMQAAIERLEQRALASGRMHEPDHRRRQQRRDGREHHDPDRGQGNRRGLERVARAPARDDRAGDRGRPS